MGRYLARRLLMVPLLLLGVTVITFALVHLTPGSPVDDVRLNTPGMRPEDAAIIERTLGLDRPVHTQYLGWLAQLSQGDLGISMTNYRPVRTLILERLPNTLLLTGLSLLLSILVVVPLGILAAVRRNSLLDHLTTLGTGVGHALPAFWVGLLLILFFSVQASSWGMPSLPSGGTQTVPGGGDIGDRLRHLVLPVLTLSFAQLAGWTRYVRAQMLETLGQDYIRTARGKGLRERAVIFGHAFRTSLLPLITLLGLSLPELVGGAALVEAIFSWPGIGNLSVQAAARHDYTLMMGLVVVVALLTLLATLATDILYALVDPRITLR